MEVEVIVPQLGQSIAEATIVRWLKKPGDRVEKGEMIAEVGTDKIDTELPAPAAGVIRRLLAEEGSVVAVGAPIAVLESEDTADSGLYRPRPAGSPGIQSASSALAEAESGQAGRPSTSPVVRKLAQEHGIDLATVKGTGEGGRVTRMDLEKLIEARSSAPQRLDDIERVPMSRMRKLIAEHMSHSRRTAADVSTFFEVDMTGVQQRREQAAIQGVKLTYLPFVIHAVARALREFPDLNASIDGPDIIYRKQIHVGMAVALEKGLIVPVIHDADRKGITELAGCASDLSERARAGRLQPGETEGGTFTITNPGVFGALTGTPIILQPQVAILGLGAVVKRPVVLADDTIGVRPICWLSLTYDHRALDGSTADSFMARLKQLLEKEPPDPLERRP